MTQVLLVEPDSTFRGQVEQRVSKLARVEPVADFQTARARLWRSRLFTTHFDLLVTNLQVGIYNGLHLVYLLAAAGSPTRSVVYSNRRNAGSAHDVQRAGAFYFSRARLLDALPAFLRAQLPDVDRRETTIEDRRFLHRGGRRASDEPLAESGPA
jgi:DNA-binding NarL/FixJ family response regulator